MCFLCPLEDSAGIVGALLPGYQSHALCIRFSAGLEVKDTLPSESEFAAEVRRARKLSCGLCKKKGASQGCVVPECFRSFHLGCAINSGFLLDYHSYVVYCKEHKEEPSVTVENCSYCQGTGTDGLLTECCKIALHKTCLISKIAEGCTACPSCGDSDTFRRGLNQAGIHVPCRQRETEYESSGALVFTKTISSLLPKPDSESALSSEKKPRRSSKAGAGSSRKKGPRLTGGTEQAPDSSGNRKQVRTLVTSTGFLSDSSGSSVRTSGSSVGSCGTGGSSVGSVDSSSATLNPAEKTTLLQAASERFSSQPTHSPSIDTLKPVKRKYKRRKVKVKYFESGKFEIRDLIGLASGEEIMDTSASSKVHSKPDGRRAKKKLVKKLALSERRLIHCRNGVPFDVDEVAELPVDYSHIPEMNKRNLYDILDLNDGEKEMMNLWNEYVSEIPGRGFVHLQTILTGFILEKGRIILQRSLYRNFVLMMNSFVDAGIIDSETCFQHVFSLQGQIKSFLRGEPSKEPERIEVPAPSTEDPGRHRSNKPSRPRLNSNLGGGTPGRAGSSSSPVRSAPGSPNHPSASPLHHPSASPLHHPASPIHPSSSLLHSSNSPLYHQTSLLHPCSSPIVQLSPHRRTTSKNNNVKRGLWCKNRDEVYSRVQSSPVQLQVLEPVPAPLPGAGDRTEIPAGVNALEISSCSVIDKIQRVSSILEDQEEEAPLVLELSDDSLESGRNSRMEIHEFLNSFTKEDSLEDLEADIPALPIIPNKTELIKSQIEKTGTDDEEKVSGEFVVLSSSGYHPLRSIEERRGVRRISDGVAGKFRGKPVTSKENVPTTKPQKRRRNGSGSKPSSLADLTEFSRSKVRRRNTTDSCGVSVQFRGNSVLPIGDFSLSGPSLKRRSKDGLKQRTVDAKRTSLDSARRTTGAGTSDPVGRSSGSCANVSSPSSPDLEVSFPGKAE